MSDKYIKSLSNTETAAFLFPDGDDLKIRDFNSVEGISILLEDVDVLTRRSFSRY